MPRDISATEKSVNLKRLEWEWRWKELIADKYLTVYELEFLCQEIARLQGEVFDSLNGELAKGNERKEGHREHNR